MAIGQLSGRTTAITERIRRTGSLSSPVAAVKPRATPAWHLLKGQMPGTAPVSPVPTRGDTVAEPETAVLVVKSPAVVPTDPLAARVRGSRSEGSPFLDPSRARQYLPVQQHPQGYVSPGLRPPLKPVPRKADIKAVPTLKLTDPRNTRAVRAAERNSGNWLLMLGGIGAALMLLRR